MTDISSLLQARYGSSSTTLEGSNTPANPTLTTLLQHKSIRHFLQEQLAPGTLEVIVAAGQSAATSSNLQTWSVVALEDEDRKNKAATLCGDQDFIRKAPLYLVFCADLSRLTHVSQGKHTPGKGLDYTEMFLIASVDATLAAQNSVVAAESLGLGICYVGGARNHPRELSQLLGLPQRVIALFGLAIGKPDPVHFSSAAVKPRLPLSEVLHRETWDDDKETQSKHVVEYDAILADFNASQQRAGLVSWTQRSAQRVATADSLMGRHILREVIEERGFGLR
ncbi:nitroreductase [Bisporella sp. PMI_857]|nr:nitroreductase [Bisporella sp. PMI_857]